MATKINISDTAALDPPPPDRPRSLPRPALAKRKESQGNLAGGVAICVTLMIVAGLAFYGGQQSMSRNVHVRGPSRRRMPTETPLVSVATTVAPTRDAYLAHDVHVTPLRAVSLVPTFDPSSSPTDTPTADPSQAPSSYTPTAPPTWHPTPPTPTPSFMPSFVPTLTPTAKPSRVPTLDPSGAPAAAPSLTPTKATQMVQVPVFVVPASPLGDSASTKFNYYYVFHLYRYTYYAQYERAIKAGKSAVEARTEATTAAKAAVKKAELPLKESANVKIASTIATAPDSKDVPDFFRQSR